MTKQRGTGLNLVRVASLYMLATLVLGLVMAISQDHALASVHSHLGLLGWAAMGMTGLAYLVLPNCSENRLALVHFWLHNIGVPLMIVSLTVLTLWSDTRAEPFIGLGALLILAGIVAFTINVFRNGRAAGHPGVDGPTPSDRIGRDPMTGSVISGR